MIGGVSIRGVLPAAPAEAAPDGLQGASITTGDLGPLRELGATVELP